MRTCDRRQKCRNSATETAGDRMGLETIVMLAHGSVMQDLSRVAGQGPTIDNLALSSRMAYLVNRRRLDQPADKGSKATSRPDGSCQFFYGSRASFGFTERLCITSLHFFSRRAPRSDERLVEPAVDLDKVDDEQP